ncbi:MAG: CapA family protein, partial [Myxococcota bacterium]
MFLLWWWACGAPSADRTLPVAASVARAELEAPRAEGREEGSVSIVAMGDILVHQAVEDAAATFAAREEEDPRFGYNAVFDGIRPLVELSDLAFANLETPVAPSRFRPRRPRVFNADPVVVDSLVDVGFDLVSLANNHAFDQGPEGLEETMEVLGKRALGYVGVGPTCEDAHAPFWVRHDDVSVAFLAATEILNENWNVRDDATCAAVLTPAAIVNRAAEARAAGADFVVLSLHWGDEYVIEPGVVRRRIARTLVEGGVDVILGHHAHVLQPVERIETADGRAALVAYGLGNLVSNQAAWYRPGVHRSRSARPRDGLALSFRLTRRRIGRGDARSVRREIVDVRAVPLWTINNEPVRTRASGTEIRVLPTRDAVAELLGEEPTDER